MAHLLVIAGDGVTGHADDERAPEQVRAAFPEDRVSVVGAARVVDEPGFAGRGSAAEWQRGVVEHVRHASPDVVLLELHLSDGLDVYRGIRAIDANVPVIFIAAHRTAEAAIEAVKHGAFDYLRKPLDLARLRSVVAEALEVARTPSPASPLATQVRDGAMLGTSSAMHEIYKAIGRVAGQDVTVLITGESGTGKELVARAIYEHSARATGPFLALNCAAIPENLLESELFGHERGAFTGADRRRIGKFEQCHGGTVLLDEIGDMPMKLQAKILRLLQDQTFERVGGNETIRTDVRLIAATHRDLVQRVADDKFRHDLYYRLGVFTIHLPPLRERAEDLPLLVQHYLHKFSADFGREVRELAPEAMARLRAYHWPGNIRELQSVLRQALLRARGTVLLPTHLPELQSAARARPAQQSFDLERFIRDRLRPSTDDLAGETHREVDRILLSLALEYTHGNYREAAQLLGISRQTLRMRLRGLGLHVAYSVAADDEDAPS